MPPAVIVKGDDPSLVARRSGSWQRSFWPVGIASMVVEEHTEQTSDAGAGPIVDALSTPPFLGDMRIVVVREAGRFPASESERIATALDDPVPGVVLVVVSGGRHDLGGLAEGGRAGGPGRGYQGPRRAREGAVARRPSSRTRR